MITELNPEEQIGCDAKIFTIIRVRTKRKKTIKFQIEYIIHFLIYDFYFFMIVIYIYIPPPPLLTSPIFLQIERNSKKENNAENKTRKHLDKLYSFEN